jgi:hypothetical protein
VLDADAVEGAAVAVAVDADADVDVDVVAVAVGGAVDDDEDAEAEAEKVLEVGVGVVVEVDVDAAEDACEGAENVGVEGDVEHIAGAGSVGVVEDEGGVERQPAPRDLEAVVQVGDQERDKDCQKLAVEGEDVEDTFGEPYIVVVVVVVVVGMHHTSDEQHGDVCDLVEMEGNELDGVNLSRLVDSDWGRGDKRHIEEDTYSMDCLES